MIEDLQAPLTEETVDAPIVEVPEVQEQLPDPKDLRAVIEHAQKEVEGRPRDEHGKFLPVEKTPASAAKSAAPDTKSPQGAQAVAEAKPLEAPATWKPEAKAAFASLPELVKAEVLRREKEVAQGFDAKANEIKQARAAVEALEPVIGPHRQYLAQVAGSVEQGVKNLLDTAREAERNPMGFIQWFAQQKGIDLGTMQQQPAGDNPVVAQLQQEVYGLRGQLQQLVGSSEEQQLQQRASEIQAYATEKDASGQPLRPHFEDVRKEVFGLIPLIRSENPNWSVRQVMDAAYTKAVRLNDDVFSREMAAKAEKDRLAKEAAERAQKASLSRKSLTGGSPVGETQRKPAKNRTVRDDILAAMEEHGTESRV